MAMICYREGEEVFKDSALDQAFMVCLPLQKATGYVPNKYTHKFVFHYPSSRLKARPVSAKSPSSSPSIAAPIDRARRSESTRRHHVLDDSKLSHPKASRKNILPGMRSQDVGSTRARGIQGEPNRDIKLCKPNLDVHGQVGAFMSRISFRAFAGNTTAATTRPSAFSARQ